MTQKKTPWNSIDKDLASWVEREADAHADWADFQNRWGALLVLERRLPEALTVFDRCLEINPDYTWARVNRLQTRALTGDGKGARADLEACSDLPERLRSHVHCFLALLEHDVDAGDRHLAAVEDPARSTPDWLRLSAALAHLRNPATAETVWKRAEKDIPGVTDIDIAPWDTSGNLRDTSFVFGLHQLFMELSSAEARRGSPERAETLAALGWVLWSDRSTYLNQRGFLAGVRGEDDAAVRLFLEAAVADTEDSRPHIALAYHYSAMDDRERAREALQNALHRAPRYADLQYQMGLLHRADNRFVDALDSLDRALDINPNYTVARMEKAEVLFQQKRWEEALTEYRQVLESGLESSDIHVRIGQLELKAGRIDLAADAFGRAGEIHEDEPLVHYFMGKIHQLRGERQEAKECWSRFLSLEVDPEMRLEIESALADEAA